MKDKTEIIIELLREIRDAVRESNRVEITGTDIKSNVIARHKKNGTGYVELDFGENGTCQVTTVSGSKYLVDRENIESA